MNSRFQTTIHAILATALLVYGGSLAGVNPAGQALSDSQLLRAVRQLSRTLHAEYGTFGALGALFGARLQIPVSAAGCDAAGQESQRCKDRA
ncbi:MAG: hypothetical protein OEW35_09725 [Gammaproteobacteria bacterium]|nr:hypothetical protein [Gammaproteobacteria bacterium]MDH4253643.1 hypothetical protein [Gammaproteobacteria bacterium]MDH5309759.1 hypothetical protein [Gammaproteobacteria bacterium]